MTEASPMKKSRFTKSQIAPVLKGVEAGVHIADVIREHGIDRPKYFLRQPKYGGASVKELTRLTELEHENAKLERM
jgi:putative transposase